LLGVVYCKDKTFRCFILFGFDCERHELVVVFILDDHDVRTFVRRKLESFESIRFRRLELFGFLELRARGRHDDGSNFRLFPARRDTHGDLDIGASVRFVEDLVVSDGARDEFSFLVVMGFVPGDTDTNAIDDVVRAKGDNLAFHRLEFELRHVMLAILLSYIFSV
jgi:hypothetical protein